MGVVDDKAAEFLEEVRRALIDSQVEAGAVADEAGAAAAIANLVAVVEGGAAAVRESGLAGTLHEMTARTVVNTVT